MVQFTLSEKIAFIESIFGSGRLARNSKNFDVTCPICAPLDSSKKKLSIHVDDDKNHCWVCGYRAYTLAPLIKRFGSRDDLVAYRNRFMPTLIIKNDDVDAERPILTLPRDFRLLVEQLRDPDAMAVKRYVLDRGITEDDMWRYKIGTSDDSRWRRRAIVPSFNSAGVLNYFVARSIDRKVRPKYDNPDVDKTSIIFNEINVDWTSRLIICEGAFDMFKCGENVVPLLGSDMNERYALFNAIVAMQTPVALALDADMWETKTLKISRLLSDYDIDVTIVDTRSFDDPGSATKEQFAAALAKASTACWESSFATRLNAASRSSMRL